MKKVTAPLLVLALLAPTISAAPAPDLAKKKLEVMKKKLPEVLRKWEKKWEKDMNLLQGQGEVKLIRQIGPTEAKVTIRLPAYPSQQRGQLFPMLTVYLSYYDGTWTSTRWHPTAAFLEPRLEQAIDELLLAIDELGDK